VVRRLISRANTSLSIGWAATILASSYFISGIFGLIRDRLLAARFGIDGVLDAYFTAFSLPDLLFLILVSGALTVTLLPVLTKRIESRNMKSAWEITASMINLLGIITLVASLVIFIFAEQIIMLIAPEFDVIRRQMAVTIMRILAINPFLFAISSIFGTVQQAYGRFFFFALAPVVYNVGIIIGILYLSEPYGIYGVAYGVVIGAVAQLLIQALGLTGLGFQYKPFIFWRNKGFRQVLRLIGPRSVDEGLVYFITIFERAIASGLAAGSIAAYQFAFNLKNYPITLIGTAIATAAFPSLSQRALSTRTDLLKKEILEVMRAILWFAVPTAIIVVLMRGYIVRLLIGFGDATVANLLGWFSVAILFQSLLRMVARIFYAQEDTKTPLVGSFIAIVVNVSLAFLFVNFYGVIGLAMAHSITSVVQVGFLVAVLMKRMGNFITREFASQSARIFLASVVTGGVTYTMVRFVLPLVAGETGFFTLAPRFSAIALVSAAAYILIGNWLKINESQKAMRVLRQFIFQRVKVS